MTHAQSQHLPVGVVVQPGYATPILAPVCASSCSSLACHNLFPYQPTPVPVLKVTSENNCPAWESLKFHYRDYYQLWVFQVPVGAAAQSEVAHSKCQQQVLLPSSAQPAPSPSYYQQVAQPSLTPVLM